MLLLAAGALTGTGVAIAAAGITARPPALAAVLAALDERTLPAAVERVSWWTRLVRRVPGAVPDSDVAVLGWSRDRFLLTRVTTTIGYAAAGPALATLSGLLDLGLPLAVPAVFTLAGALLGWTGSGGRSAPGPRTPGRSCGSPSCPSCSRPGCCAKAAPVSRPRCPYRPGCWPTGGRCGGSPTSWPSPNGPGRCRGRGCAGSASKSGCDELTDLSAIAAGAGQDGAAVVDTLLKRAESLRDELLADEHAAAHRASGQMSTPGALQVFLIAAWVLYPAAVALLSF